MKRLACAAALIWFAAAPAWAAMDAQEFVIKAGIGSMFEVQSSRVALDRLRQDRMNALNRAEGDFRRRYVAFQELTHEEAVRVFEEYAKAGENPRLTGLAEESLPMLRAHKHEIDGLAR